jgi:hypothetical protein
VNLSLNPYWQSISAPWRQRSNEGSWLGLVGMAATLLLLGAVILFAGEFSRKAILVSALVLVVLTIEFLWMLHIAATVHLNQPACVLLVPRYLPVQRTALLLLWLVLVALQMSALATAWAFGLTTPMDNAALWLLAFAGSLLFWALVIRWPFLIACAFLLTPLWLKPSIGFINALNMPGLNWAGLEHHAHLWVVPLLAAMAWLLSRTALRSGNAAHRTQVTRNAKILAALNNKSPADAYRLSVSASKIVTFSQIPFHRYASWLLATPAPGPAHALARAELGLGAKTHWVMQVINICATFALVGLGAFAYERIWGNAWGTLANPISILFLGVISLAPLANWRTALLVSAKEQSLMLLLPGMPQGAVLNRALAKRHLRHLLVLWVAMTAILLFAPWPEFLRDAWVLSVLTLPLLPLVVQDWSRVAPMTPWQVVVMVVKGIVWIPGMLLFLHLLHVPLLWLALLSTVVFVATVVWRWHRLAGFAQAFPVGHRIEFLR